MNVSYSDQKAHDLMNNAKIHPVVKEAIRNRPPFLITMWDRRARFDNLRCEVEMILNQGLNGGILKVRDRKSKNFVTFRKYIVAKGQYGIELIFSNPNQSEPYFEQFRNYCAQTGVAFDIEGKPEAGTGDALRVDCEMDVDKALALLIVILADIFGFPSGSKFDIETEGVSRWKELIDSPGQEETPATEFSKLLKKRLKATHGSGMLSMVLDASAVFCQILGVLGLLLTLVFQQDDWSGFALSVSGIFMKVPLPGLISVFLIFVGFSGYFTESRWNRPKKGDTTGFVAIPKTLRGLLTNFWGRRLNWVTVILLSVASYTWVSF